MSTAHALGSRRLASLLGALAFALLTLALPAVASLAIALMEQTRPGGAGARPHRHVTAITERLAAAFALAVDTGELDTAPDAALAAAHLIGPLVYRTTLQAAAVPDRLLAGVIDGVADWRAPDPARFSWNVTIPISRRPPAAA